MLNMKKPTRAQIEKDHADRCAWVDQQNRANQARESHAAAEESDMKGAMAERVEHELRSRGIGGGRKMFTFPGIKK